MMRFFINGRGARRALVVIGGTLIVFSILVFIFPEFFAYVFAGIVLLIGVVMFLAGLTVRPLPPPQGPPFRQTEDSTWEEVL